MSKRNFGFDILYFVAAMYVVLLNIEPVCGMTVEIAGTKSAVHDGHFCYFCSKNCGGIFEASSQSYAGGAASSLQDMEHNNEYHN